MIKGYLALILLVSVLCGLLWLVIDGLRTGIVRGKGGSIARVDRPAAYCATLALYAFVTVCWIFLFAASSILISVWIEGSF